MDLLNQWPRGQVVLDAANGVDYELRSQETGPIDIVLVDLQMPHRDGFQTTRWIRQHQRNTRVLGLSHDPTVADARELLRLGALGLLPKNAEPAEIFQALDQAAADQIHTNDLVRDALRTPALPEEEEAERVNALPDQERHVLELWVHRLAGVCRLLPLGIERLFHGRADIRQPQRAGLAEDGAYRGDGGLGHLGDLDDPGGADRRAGRAGF